MKRAIGIMLTFLLLLTISGCKSEVKEKDIIGKVNGREITAQEYQKRITFLQACYQVVQARMQSNSQAGETDVQPGDIEIDASSKEQIEEQVFQDLVMDSILLTEATAQGITVADEEVDQYLQDFKNVFETMGGEGTYQELLSYSKLTEEQVKEELSKDILKDKLGQTIAAQATITTDDAMKYYESNKDLYTQQAGIQISHILVDEEELARELITRLNQGEDFAALAREYSTCPSKEKGGDLGVVNQDSTLVTEFKEVALALQPGQITQQPVKTDFGFHIIKAGEKKEAATISFEEVQNDIISQLRQQYAASYEQGLYQQAEIEDLRK